MEKIKNLINWIRRWISPVYVTLLVAAFILWYITKLGEEYTTDHTVTVIIDGDEYEVNCTIHGKGTDLIHYTISSKRSRFEIPLSELTQDKPVVDNDGNTKVHITPESLKNALAQRMENIEIKSVGSVYIIVHEEDIEEEKVNEDYGTLSSTPNDIQHSNSANVETSKSKSTKEDVNASNEAKLPKDSNTDVVEENKEVDSKMENRDSLPQTTTATDSLEIATSI